jgi:MFS family permease
VPRLAREREVRASTRIDTRAVIAWFLCFAAMAQISFLPSILPTFFQTFNIERTLGLKLAGVVVMLYTFTAMIGTFVLTRISTRFHLRRMIVVLSAAAILYQSLLTFSRGIIDFTLIRMVQTGFVAAVIPVTVSVLAGVSRAGILGFLNSARFAGVAVGPMLATSVLAYSNLGSVCQSISGISLIALLGLRLFFKEPKGTVPPSQN